MNICVMLVIGYISICCTLLPYYNHPCVSLTPNYLLYFRSE